MIKDNKIINLKIFNTNNEGIDLNFKDSNLLLLNSLSKLCKDFKVETAKEIETILIDNETLNECERYFTQTTEHYNKEINKVHSFKDWKNKIIQYCSIDSIALYEILIKFKDLIYNLFQLNIEDYPTTPSLAFAIFRKNFIKENSIPILLGKMFLNIKNSYTGGATDMFIPYGENLHY